MPRFDTIWINAHLATMDPHAEAYGSVYDGAVAARDGRIAWVGPRSALSDAPHALAAHVIDVAGAWITPGLIDPHTHVVFGGDRIADFEARNAGESYVAAAGAGRGIVHTVARTRAADERTLQDSARLRLRSMIAAGTTTVEIKSGYGLELATELRMLRVARALGRELGITVRTTFLGAHVVPPEYAARRDDYITLICETMLPQIAADGLADAVDVFCDAVAFSPPEAARVLTTAAELGLPVKMHADQIENTEAAALAARFGALSADHLERTSDDGVRALAAAGTVAVLLPGAYYALHETVRPPVAALREHGVPIALATDCNPGTSPILTLPTALNLACVLFGLSPVEALAGATRNAARALGLDDRGVLRVGARCDLALWNVASPAELSYWLGASLCAGVVVGGAAL